MQRTKTPKSLARPRVALLSLALGIAISFGACNCDPVDVADGGSSVTDDDAGNVTGDDGGQVCDLGTDNCDCRADDTCDEDLACTNGTCGSCIWGSDGCPCLDENDMASVDANDIGSLCDGELVCDDTSAKCRVLSGCESIGCAQHQLCRQEVGEDAACVNECEAGYRWIGTACEAIPSCDWTEPGYLDCGANRVCDDQGGTAECGDCEDGFIDLDEDGLGDCVENSCDNICGVGRECEGANGLPVCGGCESGFVYDETTDTCIDRDTCDEIPACDSNTQICQEATTTADAVCMDVATCPAGQGDDGSGECVRCDECYLFDGSNATVRTGVAGLGNNGAFSNDICVCELDDGYFQSHNDGVVKPCDADGDGWVNADFASMRAQGDTSAFYLESKCSLRTVESFTLVSDDTGAGFATSRATSVEEIASHYTLETAETLGENATIKRSPAQIFYVELLEPEVLDDINEFSDRYDATNPPPKLRLHP
ncbi:MAG: hypothetical protein GY822_23035, partial [Deltaproteobacteria bacterium]|nr:hypothetical protein [Deltaproteobacteria bacterium]